MNTPEPFQAHSILGGKVHAVTREGSINWIMDRARAGDSRTVAYSTVHMTMESHDSSDFQRVLSHIDLVNTDGLPLVWVLRLMGVRSERVTGPDSTPTILERAAREGIPVGFYGGKQETLDALVKAMTTRFPNLKVAYQYSPPFRALSPEEDDAITQEIVRSGARLVFVGLGCPKQERWVDAHRGRIPAVLLAVGAAFDLNAGIIHRAPVWMQRLGLEWLHRALSEPNRLLKRYLTTNPRFVGLVLLQLLGLRQFSTPNSSLKHTHEGGM